MATLPVDRPVTPLRQRMLDDMAMRAMKSRSLADIVRMVHPKPTDAARKAFYGWLIGRPYDVAALPAEIAAFEAWKADGTLPLPSVPFEWLTQCPLTAAQRGELAERIGWQALRMNLNTLARKGAYDVDGVTKAVAARLVDRDALRTVRPPALSADGGVGSSTSTAGTNTGSARRSAARRHW